MGEAVEPAVPDEEVFLEGFTIRSTLPLVWPFVDGRPVAVIAVPGQQQEPE